MKSVYLICIVCCLFLFTHAKAGEDGLIEVRGPGGGDLASFIDGFSNVNTKPDHEIVVTLASNPTTGYQWQVMKPLAESTVKLVSHVYDHPQTGLVGAGGQEIWVFRTLGPGEAEIVLGYLRSWEKGKLPAYIRIIRLKVNP